MISIIIGFQLFYGFIYNPSIILSHRLYLWHKVVGDFLLGNTTNGCVWSIKTDVAEVIEHGEEGNLCKLSDARDEDKLLILIIRLQDGKDAAIDISTTFMLRCLPKMLERSIIFINEDSNLLTSLFVSGRNDGIKTIT